MKTKKFRLLPALAAGLVLAGSMYTAGVSAHHSRTGEFDTSVDIDVKGAVTEIEWFNPHVWIYMDVTNEEGEIEQWQCELGSPNSYIRAGWSPDDVPLGTVVIAHGNPARDGSNICSTRDMELEDGTPVFTR